MDTHPTTPLVDSDVEEKLRHLSEPARQAFLRFRAGGKPDELDAVVYAILEDFIPHKPAPSLATCPGGTRLMDDLGYDSLAITEIVFFMEDLFGISISNDEILQVRTLEDLRRFVRKKVSARAA